MKTVLDDIRCGFRASSWDIHFGLVHVADLEEVGIVLVVGNTGAAWDCHLK